MAATCLARVANMLRYLFARIYGYTLSRSYRNDPDQACQDAITPFMIVISVPLLCALVPILALAFPAALQTKDWVPWVTIPVGIVMYLGTRSIRRYGRSPEMAEKYRSPAARRVTAVLYIGVLLGSILVAGLGGRLLHRP